jgi:hypothetical protein
MKLCLFEEESLVKQGNQNASRQTLSDFGTSILGWVVWTHLSPSYLSSINEKREIREIGESQSANLALASAWGCWSARCWAARGARGSQPDLASPPEFSIKS